MGKAGPRGVLFGPAKGGRRPARCIGCQRPIMYGDRCPACANQARARAVNRKRKRR